MIQVNEFKFTDEHKKTVNKAKYLRFPTLACSATVKSNKSLLTYTTVSTALHWPAGLMPHVSQHVHVDLT